MNNLKNIYRIFSLSAIFTIVSCTDNFEDINTDKSKVSTGSLTSFGVDMSFAGGQFRNYNQNFQVYQSLFADLYSQYFANVSASFASDRYVMVDSWLVNGFNQFYQQTARPLEIVVNETAPSGKFPNPVKNAIAKIMKVSAFATRTDYWGPMPYSKFNNGELAVPYDTQEFIYKDFMKVLKESVDYLKSQPVKTSFGANDQIFGGNVDKWVKFGNSLRLRFAIRMAKMEPALAKAEAEDAVKSGVITVGGGINGGPFFTSATGDEAYFKVTANSANGLNSITGFNEFRMSSAMESYLKGFADPRMDKFFAPVTAGTTNFKGLRNGYAAGDIKGDNAPAANSNVAAIFLAANAGTTPNIVFTLAETLFLRAEGALLGWDMGGTAKDLYNDGIRASMKQWGITNTTAIEAYVESTKASVAVKDGAALSDVPVKWSATAASNLEQVLTQKWLALYPNGLEAWAEYRRTGFPKLYGRIVSENTAVGKDDVIRRVTYGSYEVINNKVENSRAVAADLEGKDLPSTKLWWNRK